MPDTPRARFIGPTVRSRMDLLRATRAACNAIISRLQATEDAALAVAELQQLADELHRADVRLHV